MKHILQCHDIANTNLVRGENCYLYDDHGKRYVDFEAGCWSAGLGYNHPRIHQIMKAQIERVIHLGTRYPNALAEEAAVQVLDITGIRHGKCVFLCSGSEAVEFSVQIARRLTEKPLLTFTTSYLAAYGSAGKKNPVEWQFFDWNSCTHDTPCDCLNAIPFENIGAFVFEPGGSGSESVKFPAPQLVQEIARRVRQAGGLLIANEITTGMGRTGKWFGFQHYDVQPDIVALGKCLGNGYPVSAVAMSQTVAEKLEASGFRYVQSHQNDPLGCAIAREVIATLREEDWIERGRASGAYLLAGLQRLAQQHNVIKEARGRGMLLVLEFDPQLSPSSETVFQALFERGFLVAHIPARHLIRFDPSLTMKKEDIDDFVACLDDILTNAA